MGHKIYTLAKIRAPVILGNRKIRYIMHVVHDDFPIDYVRILGIDFLTTNEMRSSEKTSTHRRYNFQALSI